MYRWEAKSRGAIERRRRGPNRVAGKMGNGRCRIKQAAATMTVGVNDNGKKNMKMATTRDRPNGKSETWDSGFGT